MPDTRALWPIYGTPLLAHLVYLIRPIHTGVLPSRPRLPCCLQPSLPWEMVDRWHCCLQIMVIMWGCSPLFQSPRQHQSIDIQGPLAEQVGRKSLHCELWLTNVARVHCIYVRHIIIVSQQREEKQNKAEHSTAGRLNFSFVHSQHLAKTRPITYCQIMRSRWMVEVLERKGCRIILVYILYGGWISRVLIYILWVLPVLCACFQLIDWLL